MDRTDFQLEGAPVREGLRPTDRLFLLGLALLMVLLVARASFGMEWLGDDAYTLSTASRYVQGDRPIVDSWETHFSSDMMVAPVVWVIHQLFPDGTALVLHYRYAFVLLQVLYALGVWLLLRRLLPGPMAALLGWATLLYLPYYYLLLNYNSIMIAMFTLSGLLLFRSLSDTGSTRWMTIASGITCGVGVIAYPTMIVALPFYAAGIWWSDRLTARRRIAWFLGAVVLVLVGFAALTIVWSGVSKLAESVPLFIHPGDRDYSFAAIFERFNRTRAVIGASIASSLVFTAVFVLLRKRPYRDAVALFAAVITSVATVFASPRLPHTLLYYMDIPQACALGIGTAFLLLTLFTREVYYRRLFWLLYLPTLGLALGAGVASLEGFETASMPAIVTAIAGFMALVHAAKNARSEGASPRLTWLAPVAASAVLLLYLGTDVWHYGGDADLGRLTARIEQGAYEGIHTTPDNVGLYNHYVEVFEPVKRIGGRTAFLEAFPTGYIITGVRPGAYSVWSNFASGDRWQSYLDITGNYPDTIVATRIPGPNGGLVPEPFRPPMGLRDFSKKYVEIYRDKDFAIYERRVRD